MRSLACSLKSIDNFLKEKNKLKHEIFVDNNHKNNAKKALKKMIEITEDYSISR